jgi:pyridoxamine 5'-phosphate oxidase
LKKTDLNDPPFYNDLALTLDTVRALLDDGVKNRHAAAHTPVVANIDTDGAPSQRVLILRACDWQSRRLRFHTDSRSDKVAQLGGNNKMSVLIYDETGKLQLRLTGKGLLETDPTQIDSAWNESTPFARRCYMAEAAPGSESQAPTSGLPAWIEGVKPDEEQLIPARDNFAVLYVTFDRIDWLYLANAGHRRALFEYNCEWTGKWLVP